MGGGEVRGANLYSCFPIYTHVKGREIIYSVVRFFDELVSERKFD